jgi:hypothetical protein
MLNLLSILIALIVFPFAVIGIIPLLGWMQWLVLVGVLMGVILGALSSKRTGLIINIVIGVLALVRLILSGGII